jgi:hypothetical protein
LNPNVIAGGCACKADERLLRCAPRLSSRRRHAAHVGFVAQFTDFIQLAFPHQHRNLFRSGICSACRDFVMTMRSSCRHLLDGGGGADNGLPRPGVGLDD